MLGAAYSQAVRVQVEAERGACAAAGLRAQGPAAGDAAPAPVAAQTHTKHDTHTHTTRSTHTGTRHNAQVYDTQHTDERAGSSGEQGTSEGAGQAGGNGQARHEAGQAISTKNLTTEERSPGTMRTNQHGQDDDATQSKRTAVT